MAREPEGWPEEQQTVLLGWAREADGGCARFTGEDIYDRGGRWCMDRLRRDIPAIVTYYCRVRHLYFTVAIAMVPERAVPLGVRLRRPDEVDIWDENGPNRWVLWAYKMPEDALGDGAVHTPHAHQTAGSRSD